MISEHLRSRGVLHTNWRRGSPRTEHAAPTWEGGEACNMSVAHLSRDFVKSAHHQMQSERALSYNIGLGGGFWLDGASGQA